METMASGYPLDQLNVLWKKKNFTRRITPAEKIAHISSAVTQSKGLAAGVNVQRHRALW